ncbi:MAG: YwiC-like family protein [Anaerolineales bacterium]
MSPYFNRRIAITNEHGSWVFLLSPLLIGLFIGGNWSTPLFYLIVAALAGFLIRHPVTIAVKVYSGRRSRKDLPAAWFWIAIYAFVALLMIAGLVMRGFGYVLYLALPGIPVFAWHLWLVTHRAERHQAGVEIVASGVLALSVPAAYWISVGAPDPVGWWLWGLTWLQSAASIVYAYLRLAQRQWKQAPQLKTRLQAGRRTLYYTSFNLGLTLLLAMIGHLPTWLFLPYGLQWVESIWGTLNPAVGVKPSRIGLRQLLVSSLFTLLFIICWWI